MGSAIAIVAAGPASCIGTVSVDIATLDRVCPDSLKPPGQPGNGAWIAYNTRNRLPHGHRPVLNLVPAAVDQQVLTDGFVALPADIYAVVPEWL